MTRGATGRASAGPRTPVLDRSEILARRAQLLEQPASPARAAALATIRCQLRSVDRREGYAE